LGPLQREQVSVVRSGILVVSAEERTQQLAAMLKLLFDEMKGVT